MNRRLLLRILLVVSVAILMLNFVNCDNKSNPVMEDTVSVRQFKVDQLLEEFASYNESTLKESVITVEGIVEDINKLNNRNTILLGGQRGSNSTVICDMQKNQIRSIEELEIGQPIKIKGVFKGSLKDVILLNCIISN